MTQLLDELSPVYIGSKALVLTLADPEAVRQAFTAIVVDIDYSAADQYGGIMNPIEMVVDGPSSTSFRREIFNQDAINISQFEPPSSVSFIPQEGGRFHVMVREVGHNKLYGELTVDVEGTINDPSVAQGQDA